MCFLLDFCGACICAQTLYLWGESNADVGDALWSWIAQLVGDMDAVAAGMIETDGIDGLLMLNVGQAMTLGLVVVVKEWNVDVVGFDVADTLDEARSGVGMDEGAVRTYLTMDGRVQLERQEFLNSNAEGEGAIGIGVECADSNAE